MAGSTLRRKCSCEYSSSLCPVHCVWLQFYVNLQLGEKPWADITPNRAREQLRATLQKLGVVSPNLYGTHDFRRGRAKDMQKSGASLVQICSAGQWSSGKSIVNYIDECDLERDVAFEGVVQSEDEEWIG